MTFRDGLLKARGQLVFVTALIFSTAVIIYLEALDTEERIQSRVAAELAQQRRVAAPIPAPLGSALATAMRRAEDAYGRAPGAPASRTAMLASISSAVQLGIVGQAEGLSRVEKVLDDMDRKPAERDDALVSALAAAAATFPPLRERVGRLLAAP